MGKLLRVPAVQDILHPGGLSVNWPPSRTWSIRFSHGLHRRFFMLRRLRRIPQWFTRWAELSWQDRGLIVRVAVLTVVMRGALVVVPFRRLVRYLERMPASRPPVPPTEQRRIAWAVEAVGRRLLPRRPCLTQAFVAQYLLARRGVATTLRIGVAKDDAALEAHAWLEADGEVLVGGAASPERYAPLPAFSEPPHRNSSSPPAS